jgi:hypothetical protein
VKKLASFVALALAAGTPLACEDHYSTQDAYEICQDDQARNPSAFGPESFKSCVACYESCGADCEKLASAPVEYTCPD